MSRGAGNGMLASLVRLIALAEIAILGYGKAMNAITLKAHFDGKNICLDDPYPLAPNTRLYVTVVPGDSEDDERRAWLAASQGRIAGAYSKDEPDYSDAVLREKPPGK